MSPKAQSILSRFDYAGVNILILGSTFPPIVYGFACYPKLSWIYLIFITVVCTTGFLITLMPGYDGPKYQKLRGALFLSAGLAAGVSIAHVWITKFIFCRGTTTKIGIQK